MANLRLTNMSNSSMMFVDPTDLSRTVKLSWSVASKPRLDAPKGKQVNNSRWTLKSNSVYQFPIPVGGVPGEAGSENSSITTVISASVDNSVQLIADIDVHFANLVALRADLVKGIPPSQSVVLISEI